MSPLIFVRPRPGPRPGPAPMPLPPRARRPVPPLVRPGPGRRGLLALLGALVVLTGACNLRTAGANVAGQLGDGTTVRRPAPTTVVGGLTFTSVDAGDAHTCGITDAGALYCWGEGDHSRLGLGADTSDRLQPTRVGTDSDWVQVSAGAAHTCAIRRDDDATWCWGFNGDRRSTPADTDALVPTRAVGVLHTPVVSVSAGTAHTCALFTGGRLLCWGANGSGQLGGQPVVPDSPLVTVPGSWTSVTAGGAHTCAEDDRAKLWCWGQNGDGQLGTGDEVSGPTPRLVAEQTVWQEISAGARHTCATSAVSSRLRCWGRNTRGQLGDGTTVSRATPVIVGPPSTWRSVSAGISHTCGITVDRRAHCWGANENGQLADGTQEASLLPSPVAVDELVEQVSAGGQHTALLRSEAQE